MYAEKIQKLENEILELKKYIKKDKKEIKKQKRGCYFSYAVCTFNGNWLCKF